MARKPTGKNDDSRSILMLANVRTFFDDMLEPHSNELFRFAGSCLNVLLGAVERAELPLGDALSISNVIDQFNAAAEKVRLQGDESEILAYLRRVAHLNPGLKALARKFPAGRQPSLVIYLFFIVNPGDSNARDTVRIQAVFPFILVPKTAIK